MINYFLKTKNIALITIWALFPALVYAQDIGSVATMIRSLVNIAIPVLIGLGVVLFFWGLVRYVVSSDENTKKEARSVIIYGIITLFVMVSVWSLVYLLSRTLNIDIGGTRIPLKTIRFR
jgi:diacylglycerol kinase